VRTCILHAVFRSSEHPFDAPSVQYNDYDKRFKKLHQILSKNLSLIVPQHVFNHLVTSGGSLDLTTLTWNDHLVQAKADLNPQYQKDMGSCIQEACMFKASLFFLFFHI